MNRRAIATFAFGLLLTYSASPLSATGLPTLPSAQQITPAPAGPFHTSGNQIIDSRNRPFLMRGTQLTDFHLQTAAQDNRAGDIYGAHSATSLSAIRLRFNMNTVRLPLDVAEAESAGYFAAVAKVVRRANDIDLLVILAAREPGAALPTSKTAEFWKKCAAYFKDYPNVMFDAFTDPSPIGDAHSAEGWAQWRAGMMSAVEAIRSTGAKQPILVMSWKDDRQFEGFREPLADTNVIYEVSPSYSSTQTDTDRDSQFGFLAKLAPVSANGLDLNLNNPAECAAIPNDPTAAGKLVQGNLNYFDAHQISWTMSVFAPGHLIKDLAYHDASTLENGWTCGTQVHPYTGMGRVIEGHLRGSEERGLFVVSGSGGMEIGRGAFALAYGPVMAAYDARSTTKAPPTSLGKISINITDAAGATRPAGILWASEGWGQTNFVIPKDSATGPARMTIVRADGSRLASNIIIADTAPGFVTGHSCRGPAIGSATQVFKDGHSATSPLSSCKGIHCTTIPVPVSAGATTRVQLSSTGFRNAGRDDKIRVTIGGVAVRVVAFEPGSDPGEDHLTIEIPAALRGLGETDLICHVNGRVSNAVRIHLGS